MSSPWRGTAGNRWSRMSSSAPRVNEERWLPNPKGCGAVRAQHGVVLQSVSSRRRQASRDAACGKFVVAFARPFRDATAGAFVPRALASVAAAPVEKADASAAARAPERRCFCWG